MTRSFFAKDRMDHVTRPRACALALLGVLAACHRAPAEAPPTPETPVNVTTAPVVEQAVTRTIPVTGTLIADLRTELTANASGRVIKTFKIGRAHV